MLAKLRTPHIGEYVTETNAIGAHGQMPAMPRSGQRQALDAGIFELFY